jgi:predicted nucleotidyltransferase
VTAIREEVHRLDPAAEIYLYGSRVDDRGRGGDIDLWVRSARINYEDALRLKVRIKDRIGWQKLDLTVSSQTDHPLAGIAEETGIRL